MKKKELLEYLKPISDDQEVEIKIPIKPTLKDVLSSVEIKGIIYCLLLGEQKLKQAKAPVDELELVQALITKFED